MAEQLPEWVERYRREVGQWPPGWAPHERKLEPVARVGSGLVALLMLAAIVVVLGFVVWFLTG